MFVWVRIAAGFRLSGDETQVLRATLGEIAHHGATIALYSRIVHKDPSVALPGTTAESCSMYG